MSGNVGYIAFSLGYLSRDVYQQFLVKVMMCTMMAYC